MRTDTWRRWGAVRGRSRRPGQRGRTRVSPSLDLPVVTRIEAVHEAGVEGALRPKEGSLEFGCEAVSLLQHQVQPLERVDVPVPVALLDEVLLYPRFPRIDADVGSQEGDIAGDLAVRGAAVQVQVGQFVLRVRGQAVKGAATAGRRCPGFRPGGADARRSSGPGGSVPQAAGRAEERRAPGRGAG